MLFYTARIALLKGNFTFVSIDITCPSERNVAKPMSLFVSAGPGKVSGMHRSTAGVASDPPPVLLGVDVGLLL